MSVLDPTACPRVGLVPGDRAADGLAEARVRGLTLGIRRRLPCARVVVAAQTGEWDARLLLPGGSEASTAADFGIPPGTEAARLCSAALPDDLRDRRLALLRRLGWLPEGRVGLVVSADATALAERMRTAVTGSIVIVGAHQPAGATPAGLTRLPAEVSIDDLAAVVSVAGAVAGSDALLVALADGAGVPMSVDEAGITTSIGASATEPASGAGLDAVLAAAAALALASWIGRGRPGDVSPRLLAARRGARSATDQVERAALAAELAATHARLVATERQLSAVVGSRTWRYTEALRHLRARGRRS